jgi:hypothetical protein
MQSGRVGITVFRLLFRTCVRHAIFAGDTEFRISFKNKAIRDDFNRGLRQIRKQGLYQKIYVTYLK